VQVKKTSTAYDKIIMDKINRLIDALSRQANFTNKIWLILAFVSVISIMPIDNTSNKCSNTDNLQYKMALPFDLGCVDKKDYYPFTLLLLSILIIGYGSAHIQAFRTRQLIQNYIDNKADDALSEKEIKNIVDCSVDSTFNRVGPIAQVILGKHQFKNPDTIPKNRKYISASFYTILKVATFIIIYLIPMIGLYKSFIGTLSILDNGTLWLPTSIFWIFSLLALIVILFTLYADFRYLKNGFKDFIK
jgi:hypothetical protein